MKNYGLNLDLEKIHRSDNDWVFGAFSTPCIASIPESKRLEYLPKGEVQRGIDDTMDCATRAPINILETKFNYLYRNNIITPENRLWLEQKGYVNSGNVEFSDAFISIKSGTTREGNSLKAPLQAIENYGLIPKSMLPLLSTMTFDEYQNPNRITDVMDYIGQEFKKRFHINYEIVNNIHYNELYEGDMVVQAGFAWPSPINGEYPKVDYPFNHVWAGICRPFHTIFDNYIDPVDGDFIKKLVPDYNLLDYGYRLFISAENKVINMPLTLSKQSLWSRIFTWLLKLYE